MSAESTIVLFPKYTTLIWAGEQDFTTLPLDVSRFGSAQFQIQVGDVTGGSAAYEMYLEESLDTVTWQLGASAPRAVLTDNAGTVRFVSYAFRLRWFRLRVHATGNEGLMVCWAEGLLR